MAMKKTTKKKSGSKKSTSKKMSGPLKFWDLRKKKPFTTSNYKIKTMKTKTGTKMKFAVAMAPSGAKSTRILGKA